MEWYLRFVLGLPCRIEDAHVIRRHFPELLRKNKKPLDDRDLPYLFYLLEVSRDKKDFLSWLSESGKEEREPIDHSSSEQCTARRCPLRNSESSGGGTADDPPLLELIIGGGHGRKEPKGEFLNLVKRFHAKDKVKQVIITDPYFLADVGEDGDEGGYVNAVDYLSSLPLNKSSSFILKTNPSPKRSSEKSEDIFQSTVRSAFPLVTFGKYPPRYKFHDRLYLVLDVKKGIRGVFGPSLNGLSSDAIILMGEIDDEKVVKVLKEWLG